MINISVFLCYFLLGSSAATLSVFTQVSEKVFVSHIKRSHTFTLYIKLK